MKGVIVDRDVQYFSNATPNVHVRAGSNDCGVIFVITPSTEISSLTSFGVHRPATSADLVVGKEVDITFDVIAESCPGQSAAKTVVILP